MPWRGPSRRQRSGRMAAMSSYRRYARDYALFASCRLTAEPMWFVGGHGRAWPLIHSACALVCMEDEEHRADHTDEAELRNLTVSACGGRARCAGDAGGVIRGRGPQAGRTPCVHDSARRVA